MIGDSCQPLNTARASTAENSGVRHDQRQVHDMTPVGRTVRVVEVRVCGFMIVGPVISVVAGSLMHFESVQLPSTLRLFFNGRCSDSSIAL